MATATTHLVSADEFFDFVHRPENRDRFFELDEGEIVEMPSPGERHGVVCGNLAYLIGAYVRAVKKGRVLTNDTGIILDRDPDTVRGPDISFYADSKKYADLSPKFAEELPSLVIEVLSPSDQAMRVFRRLNRFLDRGANMVWLVDPESRIVTIWWQGRSPIVLDEADEIAELPSLPDFRCRVSEVFDPPGGA